MSQICRNTHVQSHQATFTCGWVALEPWHTSFRKTHSDSRGCIVFNFMSIRFSKGNSMIKFTKLFQELFVKLLLKINIYYSKGISYFKLGPKIGPKPILKLCTTYIHFWILDWLLHGYNVLLLFVKKRDELWLLSWNVHALHPFTYFIRIMHLFLIPLRIT